MRMVLMVQQVLLCFASLLLALSCASVGTTPNAANAPHVPAFTSEAAETVVLSPEDQTEDALNSTRRADESGRTEGGGLPQLTPQEHMRRAAIYQANRAFEEARAHWRTLIERYPAGSNVPAAYFGIGRTL